MMDKTSQAGIGKRAMSDDIWRRASPRAATSTRKPVKSLTDTDALPAPEINAAPFAVECGAGLPVECKIGTVAPLNNQFLPVFRLDELDHEILGDHDHGMASTSGDQAAKRLAGPVLATAASVASIAVTPTPSANRLPQRRRCRGNSWPGGMASCLLAARTEHICYPLSEDSEPPRSDRRRRPLAT